VAAPGEGPDDAGEDHARHAPWNALHPSARFAAPGLVWRSVEFFPGFGLPLFFIDRMRSPRRANMTCLHEQAHHLAVYKPCVVLTALYCPECVHVHGELATLLAPMEHLAERAGKRVSEISPSVGPVEFHIPTLWVLLPSREQQPGQISTALLVVGRLRQCGTLLCAVLCWAGLWLCAQTASHHGPFRRAPR